ncbi:MAG TPA: lysine transporter LysE [Rhodospirillaceae bacterium]|nr:lysine transporter LysE [Rhodospirillaceae bacterium]
MFGDLDVFLRGLVLGIMVAAPVGPVGLLCIRRTIHKGLFIGFASGFGAAFADAFFSAVAALGVTAITDILQTYNDPIHVVGGAFLVLVAWHTWHDKLRDVSTEEVEKKYLKRAHLHGALKAMATSFVITITNPATIFGVMAVVATFGGLRDRFEAGMIIAGIFAGSSLWWLMLSGGVSLFRKRFTEKGVTTLNRVTAVILVVIATWAVAKGLGTWD